MAPHIVHRPLFDREKTAKLFSEKDCVDVKYVCTTSLPGGYSPRDILYRETPHPEFGNRYLSLSRDMLGQLVVANADAAEGITIDMAVDSHGDLHYSRYRHDCNWYEEGHAIDGGREYTRRVYRGDSVPYTRTFEIKDGELVETCSS